MKNYLFAPFERAPGVVMREGLFEGCTDRIKRITFCAVGQIRMRTIVARSRERPTGKFSSWKNGRPMEWESQNEKNAFTHLDFRYDILAYREQACEIVYVDDEGKEATHFPDNDVLAMSGSELWEIKPKKFADRAIVRRRTDILSADLAILGITYRMVYAEQLRREPQLRTMDKILTFGRRPVAHDELAMIRNELAMKTTLNWGDARRGELGQYGREILCRLVLEGRLTVNDKAALTDHSEFWLGPRGV
jgi:hypothetical protein